jgi:hypothetical protein
VPTLTVIFLDAINADGTEDSLVLPFDTDLLAAAVIEHDAVRERQIKIMPCQPCANLDSARSSTLVMRVSGESPRARPLVVACGAVRSGCCLRITLVALGMHY